MTRKELIERLSELGDDDMEVFMNVTGTRIEAQRPFVGRHGGSGRFERDVIWLL